VGDYTSIIVHGLVILFGLFGIGVSVVLVNFLLFIGSAITLAAVGYSLIELIIKISKISSRNPQ
jgi:hypothetical protein